jgi:hypothetical protein
MIYGIYDIVIYGIYWLFNIAMENGPFMNGLIYLLKIVIFHGYVK